MADELLAGLTRPDDNPSAMPTRSMGNAMNMGSGGMDTMKTGSGMAMDLNDVDYDAFLANDRTLADPEIVRVEPGGHVLLRVINASSMSNYHLDLGQLKGELIAVDGLRIVPGMALPWALMASALDCVKFPIS